MTYVPKYLLSPYASDKLHLENRVVMAPMNRRRAPAGILNASAEIYYRQRASAGLIITDNTAVAANGIGYLNTPGIYNDCQIAAWKRITKAVHEEGGKIFIQLVHAGRIGHVKNNRDNKPLVAPSQLRAEGTVRTVNGYLPMSEPVTLTTKEARKIIALHVRAAGSAIDAGFDGVEVHGAHGYLAEQFLHPLTNQRRDQYGGSIENRSRFLLEIMTAVSDAIGKKMTGVRLSPFSTDNDLPLYEEEEHTHVYLAKELDRLGILYLHLSDLSPKGGSPIPKSFIRRIRQIYTGTLIAAGNYTAQTADDAIKGSLVDLVAFGRPFIANPDLVERFRMGYPLAEGDPSTYYQGGDSGYIDYTAFSWEALECCHS
jgi:N-ethylmaleimide reductase